MVTENRNMHNNIKTCLNCPAANVADLPNFENKDKFINREKTKNFKILIEYRRRPELGLFEPKITFDQCPEWKASPYGYLLKGMKVMILGIDGYLGWPLALKLGRLGCDVSGIDNFSRRNMVYRQRADTAVPISDIAKRLQAAKEVLGIDIKFEIGIYG